MKYIIIRSSLSAFLGLVLLLRLLPGCAKQEGSAGSADTTGAGTPTLRLSDPEAVAGLHMVRPEPGPLFDEAMLPGRLDFDPDLVSRVFTPVNGIVAHVHVNPGDRVRKGAVLCDIASGDFAGAVSDYQKAEAGFRTAEKNMARARELAEAKILSQRELQQAVSDSASACAERTRALHVLELLNATTTATGVVYSLRAPIDGVVLERTAQIGSQVKNDNSQSLFTVGRTRDVWVSMDVYQDQFQHIAPGDSVVVSVDGVRDTSFSTHIEFVSPSMDPATMTGKARCRLDNQMGLFRPNMFCSAHVFHPRGTAMFLPASAAFYDGDGKTYVFVKCDHDRFEKREVRVGRILRDRVEFLAGLRAGEQVVANRGIFLNEEMQQVR
ncbi:MAG TPA: efflux RND transporter periplasmic adaptor subunit [Bacteroidota bacterium]